MVETRSFGVKEVEPDVEVWHTYPVEEVLVALDVTRHGLTEHAVADRRREYGRNVFTEVPAPGIISRTFAQLKSPLTLVLVVAFFLTLALEEYIDAGVILFALAIAVGVGVLQEGKASRAFQKLADSQVKMATVIRNGEKHEIPAADVVVGDVVEVVGGVQIPADLRLIETKKLAINESALTGEWMPVRKQREAIAADVPFAERANMAWMGTFVLEGHGLGVVVATGDATAVGELAQHLHTIEEEETPLQVEMRRVSKFMLRIILALVVIIFAIGIYQGQPLEEMLLMSVAIAVASVPEGLPAAVTIVLAIGMEMLLARGGLVRNLLAAETLGSTTYVLTDKTGTLTLARMMATGVILHESTNLSQSSWEHDPGVRELFETALTATDAYRETVHGADVLRGDPIEQAILEAATSMGIDMDAGSLRARRTDHLAFESENRFAAGLVKTGTSYRLCVNGAPEYLLEIATAVHGHNGVRAITALDRSAYESAILTHTKEGKRLVAVAYKEVRYDSIPEDVAAQKLIDTDLVFMGVLIFNDPVRKRVGAAIEGVKNAGAKVMLITGDNPETALSVARTVGIAGPFETALTGDDIAELSDDEMIEVFETVHVFARILPRQKMRIAQILQSRGEIVAMTGDGINDAPALRRANIGIAVGSGTEVAKEASDLVLVEDSFEIIYAAIEEGRRIIANLRKIVGYLLSTSLSEVVLIGAALATGAAAPLVPAQILWANVIEEGLMSFAFAFEKGSKNAMKRRPQDIHEEGILSREMLWFVCFVVVVHGALLLSLYFYLRSLNIPLYELRSAMFLMIAIDSLFMAFAFRSLTTPIWKIPFLTNMFFLASFVISSAMLAIVLAIPFFQRLLSYHPLPFEDILFVAGFSVASLVIIEISKWLFFEHRAEVVE